MILSGPLHDKIETKFVTTCILYDIITVKTNIVPIFVATPTLGSMSSGFDSDDDDSLGKKKNKRGVLPKSATQIMKSWLFQHIVVSSNFNILLKTLISAFYIHNLQVI